MEPWLRQVLRCPACKGTLEDRPDHLVCVACGLAYPIEEGVPALLGHRAVPLGGLEIGELGQGEST
jgi:uncharacterized protein YbaR (Trm112 family)